MTELLKEEHSENMEGMEPRDLDMAKVSRTERVYKALWSHVYPIYQAMSGHVYDKECSKHCCNKRRLICCCTESILGRGKKKIDMDYGSCDKGHRVKLARALG